MQEPVSVQLSPEEEAQYGGWNRVALAGGHLCRLVEEARSEGSFILGLLADCNGCLGVLGGLQSKLQDSRLPKIGLVYVDAHGDYNTPDTSPSGMLGGMPVAVLAGKCLPRLRNRSGLVTSILFSDIIMAGMRDLDELEKEAIAEDELKVVRENDLIELSPDLRSALADLSARVDTIYVHVDLDILDPIVAPAAGLPSPGGLTGEQLGRALAYMVGDEKVSALSLVSYRADGDDDGRTLKEVMRAILLATSGLGHRGT